MHLFARLDRDTELLNKTKQTQNSFTLFILRSWYGAIKKIKVVCQRLANYILEPLGCFPH